MTELSTSAVRKAFVKALAMDKYPKLFHYSVYIDGNLIKAMIIVWDTISQEEMDDIYDVAGYMVGEFTEARLEFDVVHVNKYTDIAALERLPITLLSK